MVCGIFLTTSLVFFSVLSGFLTSFNDYWFQFNKYIEIGAISILPNTSAAPSTQRAELCCVCVSCTAWLACEHACVRQCVARRVDRKKSKSALRCHSLYSSSFTSSFFFFLLHHLFFFFFSSSYFFSLPLTFLRDQRGMKQSNLL